MSRLSRREFLKAASALMANIGLSKYMFGIPQASTLMGSPGLPKRKDVIPLPAKRVSPKSAVRMVADALTDLSTGRVPVLWLHGLACSGCSVSFLNSAFPDPAALITRYLSLDYSSVVSAASGAVAMQVINQRISAGEFLLVVEGAVPVGMPEACRFGDEPFSDLLVRAANKSKATIALGNCAAFGGIPAAPPNTVGAEGVQSFFRSQGISIPVINLPGCPTHPDWLVGTLVYLLKLGMPTLTEDGSPEMFFGEIIHSQCPHFYQYNSGEFAQFFGEEGCLFMLGCLGIRTYADCPTRRWNNKQNWCVEAGGPCIGCASPEFAQQKDFPFYRIRELE